MSAELKEQKNNPSSFVEPLDELSFFQRVMQNPEQLDEQVQAFLAENPEQKRVVQQARKMNQVLKSALTAVQPPEQLTDKILLQTTQSESTIMGCLKTLHNLCWQRLQKLTQWLKEKLVEEKWRWVSGSALASAILLVALMPQIKGLNTSSPAVIQGEQIATIEQALLEHLHKHPDLVKKTDVVPVEQLQAKLEAFGASLAQPMDFVTHVSECNIHGIKGLHLVVQSFSGPVTVIMLPKVTVPEMVAFKEQVVQGELVPVKGATLAILGHNLTQIGWAQMAMLNHINFGEKPKKKQES